MDLEDKNLSFSNDVFEDFEIWDKAVSEKAEIVRKLSDKYKTKLVDLNGKFKTLNENIDLYSVDGIHPTVLGHKIIADEWLKECMDILL